MNCRPRLPDVSPGLRATGLWLLASVAWLGLLLASLGGPVGALTQTLAGKLPAQILHLQRLSGAAASPRAAQREGALALRTAQATPAHAGPPADAPSAPGTPAWHGAAEPQRPAPALLAAAPRPLSAAPMPASPQHARPPGRAPPIQA